MTAVTASRCLNPEHPEFEGTVCPACHAALEAEHTALSDRYMRVLRENLELERRVREAEGAGTVPLNADGLTRENHGPLGIEMVNGTDALQLRGRTRKPSEDVLVLACLHRTTGSPRAILLERSMVVVLTAWMLRWLSEGWPGVPRRCGAYRRPTRLREWKCDQEPGHGTDHEGPATGWPSGGKPGRESWPLSAAERQAVRDAAALLGSRG